MRKSISLFFLALLALTSCVDRAGVLKGGVPRSETLATAEYFNSIRENPPRLRMFLQEMPKGADLHNHVSGAVYAESYIQWAAKGGFCVNLETFALTNPPCDEATTPPVAKALKNEKLYSAIVDALSMRNYFPGQESGHDHFFSAFGEFSAVSGAYKGDMLAEVASRAAAQHVFYLELMTSFQASAVNAIAERVPWSDDLGDSHRKLIRAGLLEQVPKAQAELDETEVRMREVLDCGSEEVDPACSMPIRYLAQVHRQSTREKVFAQSVFAYELAKREPRVVGLNFVAPEDSLVSLADYDVHMGILDYLSGLENPINVALHAGELTLGLVPPRYLRSHIAKAVRKGHARRIGHGVDIAYEENASALLREMAERKVLVEILLTSNAQILQVKGRDHPFPVYMAAGVPVTLATDDEGVERIDLTHEYVRAVLDYDLTYDDVKTLSRNGLEYAFLPGTSLWKTRAPGFEFVEPCENEHPAKGRQPTSPECSDYLKGSPRAQLQWNLEAAFRDFEREFAK